MGIKAPSASVLLAFFLRDISCKLRTKMPRVRQPFSHPGMVPQSAETHASSQITVTLTILILPMPHNFLIPARSPHSPSSAPLRKNHAATVAEIMFRACGFFHMKRLILLFVLTSVAVLAMPAAVAAPLTGARITHIVNDVKTVSPGKPPQSAALNELVEPGKAVRTGIDSRTELLFTDQTITRLGANSHFTVNGGTREISLSKGVILLQVPKGSGGAKIQTNAVTAAITGTTILFEILNGFTKLTVLEGTCILVLKNDLLNRKTTVTAGHQVRFSNNATEIPAPRRVSLRVIFRSSPLLAGAWGVRLDQTHLAAALAAQDGIDFGGIGILKVKGVVLVNKKPAKNGDTIGSGDIIETSADQTLIIVVTGGGEIFIGRNTRARIGGGGSDPVTATALFGNVKTFGLEDTNDDTGYFEVDLGPYLPALGFGNVSGPSGGGSSASGGVITVAQPNGEIWLYDNFRRFLGVQKP